MNKRDMLALFVGAIIGILIVSAVQALGEKPAILDWAGGAVAGGLAWLCLMSAFDMVKKSHWVQKKRAG